MSAYPVVPIDVRIVVADANVLYPRVIRDYLLIAAEHEIIQVHWSPQILTDTADHLIANRRTFDQTAAVRLTSAMTADALFLLLMDEYLPQMIDTHRTTVAHFRGATDDSTLAALQKAGARATAHRMAQALGLGAPT